MTDTEARPGDARPWERIVIVTHGGRFGGYGLYLLKGKPVFLYNLLALERFRWEGTVELAAGKHTIVFDFKYDGPGPGKGRAGTLTVDGTQVSSKAIPHTIPFLLNLGETFDIGSDRHFADLAGKAERHFVVFVIDSGARVNVPIPSPQTESPIGSFEGHLSRDLGKPRLWASLDGNFWFGGTTSLNGIEKPDTRQASSRIGGTLSVPVGKHQSIKFAYSKGTFIRFGGDYHNIQVAWQYSWLGRPN